MRPVRLTTNPPGTTLGRTMATILYILGFFVLWFVLQKWILPMMGVGT